VHRFQSEFFENPDMGLVFPNLSGMLISATTLRPCADEALCAKHESQPCIE